MTTKTEALEEIIERQATELHRLQGLLAKLEALEWATRSIDECDHIETKNVQKIVDLYHQGLPR